MTRYCALSYIAFVLCIFGSDGTQNLRMPPETVLFSFASRLYSINWVMKTQEQGGIVGISFSFSMRTSNGFAYWEMPSVLLKIWSWNDNSPPMSFNVSLRSSPYNFFLYFLMQVNNSISLSSSDINVNMSRTFWRIKSTFGTSRFLAYLVKTWSKRTLSY